MKNKILTLIIALVLVAVAVVVTATFQNQKTAAFKNDLIAELDQAESKIAALKSQIQLTETDTKPYKEIFVDMLRRVDYQDKTVYVIGHKTPDSDTVASAIGMAYLLNQLGIEAEARIAGELNLETTYALSILSYSVPEILEDAAEKQLWLVDHSTSSQMVNGAEKARIVGITDHHGIGDAEISDLICVLSCPAGSTCSIVSELCDGCDVKLPNDVASVLLAGLLSDTANMKSNDVTKLDEKVFAKLKELSGITDTDALFTGMLEAKFSYKGLNDKEIFYSDYKDYEHNGFKYGIGCIKVARPEQIPAMAERMLAVIKEEKTDADFLLYHIYDPDYSVGYTAIVGKDTEFTEQLMDGAFGEIAQKSGEYYVFTPSLSRKQSIVPPIDDYLDTVK